MMAGVRNIFWSKKGFVAALAGGVWLLSITVGQSGGNTLPGKKTLPKPVIMAADSLDKETGLVVAPGFVMVKAICIRCHSAKLITNKRATRDGWIATIRWMQKSQGLWDLGGAEPQIVDYLARHYAPTATGRRPLLQPVTWYKL